jgi:hypothetical protein
MPQRIGSLTMMFGTAGIISVLAHSQKTNDINCYVKPWHVHHLVSKNVQHARCS